MVNTPGVKALHKWIEARAQEIEPAGFTVHRENTLFHRAVTGIWSQRLLHFKWSHIQWSLQGSFDSSLSQETQYSASVPTDNLVQCIWRNIDNAQEKLSLQI